MKKLLTLMLLFCFICTFGQYEQLLSFRKEFKHYLHPKLNMPLASDEFSQLNFIYEEEYNQTLGIWEVLVQNDYYYDENGNVVLLKNYDRESASDDFEFNGKETHSYDENGYRIASYYYDIISQVSPDLFDFQKELFTYDEYGNCIVKETYERNSPNDTYKLIGKEECTYTDNALPEAIIESELPDGGLELIFLSKKEYTYNELGDVADYHRYRWETQINSWVLWDRGVYIYDENNKLQEIANQEWYSNVEGNWVNIWKEKYYYNTNGFTELYEYYEWDEQIGDWQIYSKKEHSLDDFGNSIEMIDYEWSEETDTILYGMKFIVDYDTEFQLTNVYQPYSVIEFIDYFMKLYFFNPFKIIEVAVWDQEANQWLSVYRFRFDYSEPYVRTTVKELAAISVAMYPNPANNFLWINIGKEGSVESEIFDVTGKLIMKAKVNSFSKIDVSSLKSGMYIISLKFDGHKRSKKFIIKK